MGVRVKNNFGAGAAILALLVMLGESPSNLGRCAEVDQGSVDAAAIQGWLRELDSSSYRTRQLAFLNLWKLGHQSRETLEEVAKGSDLNLACSAKWLMLVQKLGASPAEVGDGIANLGLVQAGDFYTLVRMAQEHQWGQILVLLELLSEEQLEELQEQSSPEQLFGLAVADGRVELLPVLADYFLSPTNALAVRHQWRRYGMEVADVSSPGAARSDKHSPIFGREWQGDVDQAIRLAQETSVELADFLRHRHFRWSELVPPTDLTAPRIEGRIDSEQFARIARECRYLEWAGDDQRKLAWEKFLLDVPAERIGRIEKALGLTLACRPDEGLALFEQQRAYWALLGYKIRGQVDKALAVAGIKLTDEFDWEEFVDSRRKELEMIPEDLGIKAFLMIQAASILHALGMVDRAEQIEAMLVRLVKFHPLLKDDERIIQNLLRKWREDDRLANAFEFVGDPLMFKGKLDEERRRKQELMLSSLFSEDDFPDFHRFAVHLLRTLKRVDGKEGTDENYVPMLQRLYEGGVLDHWNGVSELERFTRQAYGTFPSNDEDRSGLAEVLVRIALNAGYVELAARLMSDFAGDGYNPELLTLISARLGDFESALHQHESDGLGQPIDLLEGLQKAAWLEQLGRVDMARKTRDTVWKLPLWPNYAQRDREGNRCVDAARELKDRGFESDALALLELGLSLAQPDDLCMDQIAEVLAEQIEKSDPERALNLARLTQVEYYRTVHSTNDNPLRLMLRHAHELRCGARAAIRGGDFELADSFVRRSVAFRPDDIEVAIELVPLAEKAFGQAKAESWYRIYREHHLAHLERWPNDAMFLNNLAWMQAKLKRDLDDALAYAEKAVSIKPINTYLDTLAEVEYQRGNGARAIELTRACIRKNGKDKHHREQLLRFVQSR
jgi:hypothetical protein